MNDIIVKENLQFNIDRLDAQRHLYVIVKRYTFASLFLCVIVPILTSFAKVIFPGVEPIIKGAIVYSFATLFVKQFLSSRASSLRNLAARIQQLFDCELFDLSWNEPLCGKKPQPEEIHDAKTGKNLTKLNNWYEPVIGQLPQKYGVIVCMRTNVTYDQKLRRTFSWIVEALIVGALIFVFSIGFKQNDNMWDWFLNALVPLSPIISWFIDIWKQNNNNIEALNKLQSLIDKSLNMAISHQEIPVSDLDRIQNFMFVHRNTSYTIPERIYNMLRKKTEDAAKYSAQQICEQMMNHA